MFKIALNAGHYLNTSGKRCLKKLDKNETREWTLNNRICDLVEKNLKAYTGYSLLRIDDTTGKTDISVEKRAQKANDFGADIYVSLHHNAGIKGGKGGGIMVYTYLKVDTKTKKLQKTVYDKLIKYTALKGDRAEPLAKADFAECRLTKMPAILIENGFMDSSTDVPV
ncbi:MAG: N-acetylmuramoyl-L-alanine amidase, partial [Clostridia bacterium]|nr:N-acetylmuramoyl-L-alanine amidase [Clostridia bacterium]